MAHDHEQSERERQQYEREQEQHDLVVERQVGMVLEGALSRIASSGTGPGMNPKETARLAIAAAAKLRARG